MKTDIFPLNYFKSVWTPIQAFKNRHQLNWLQLFIVLVFLNGLLTIPVTMNYAGMNFIPLEDFYPNAIQVIDGEVVDLLQTTEIEDGQMTIETPFIHENDYGFVAANNDGVEEQTLSGREIYIVFEENQFLIKEVGAPLTTVLYTKDFRLDQLETDDEIKDELSRQWFNQNQIMIILLFSLMISAFMFIMTLFVILGSALFLYFTKKSDVTSIRTYKESINLVLNSITLPTMVAMIIGILHFDVTIMVSIQSIGLIIMLFVVYYKTYFNDERLAER